MKTSRAFFSEVERRFDAMPFTLRACEDEKKARMDVVEYAKHELLQSFNVLYEKEGEFVAQFKFTVLLMPNGPMRITSDPFEPDLYKFEMEVQDAELKALLQIRKPRKRKKKKASKTAENATSGETLKRMKLGTEVGPISPACCSCLIPLPPHPRLCEVQFVFSTQDRQQSRVSLPPSLSPPNPFQQQPAPTDS
ncbi:hypothetical protein GH733_017711, partial [Mirounga leonina]